MSVHLREGASPLNPLEEVAGKPVRLPAVLLCTMGERFCGKVWTANTQEQYLLKSAERREHEATCNGGLIVIGDTR